jgi:chromosome segregation ATPase
MEKTEDWKARAHTNEESVRILQDHIRLLKLDFEEKLRAKDIAHEKSHAEWLLEKEKFVESAKQAAQRLQGERKEKRKFREAHKEVSKELQGSVSEIAELRKAVNDNKSKPQRMDKQIREVVKQLHEQEVNVAQLSKAKEALEIGLAEEMSTKARLREVPGSPWGHFVMTMGFRIQRKHFYLVESQGKWRQVRKRAEGILKNWYASEYEVFVKEAIEGDDEFFAFDEDDVVLQTKRSKF